MKASFKSVSSIIGKPSTQYLIPVFQRVYSWNNMQWEQLWSDMVESVENSSSHFMGTFISRAEKEQGQAEANGTGIQASADDDGQVSKGTGSDLGYERVSLIDGQQRLATVTLMVVALRDILRDEGETSKANELDRVYLHSAPGVPKLVLSEADSPTMAHLVDGAQAPDEDDESQLLIEGYGYFKEQMEKVPTSVDIVMKGFDNLSVVAVELEDDDAPQQVFESFNAKGRPLSTIDLLRNVVMEKFEATEQTRLFEQYWLPIDEAFRKFGAEQDIYLDAALHSWTEKNAPSIHVSKRSELYQAFKTFLGEHASADLADLLKSINQECLAFAAAPGSPEAKDHLDWAEEKPRGLISRYKLFGD